MSLKDRFKALQEPLVSNSPSTDASSTKQRGKMSSATSRKSNSSQAVKSRTSAAIAEELTPLPTHWYIFFGILEPISVLAGCIYSIFFQENFYLEQVPEAFAPPPYTRSLLGGTTLKIEPSVRMALAQLGSCYFLIMLNSALMFYALRRFVKNPVQLENILYFLFFVLGAADWTHIGLTLYMLPSPPHSSSIHGPSAFAKLSLLMRPSSWNSLLFGNVIITFILFCFRAAWWVGIGRASGGAFKSHAE